MECVSSSLKFYQSINNIDHLDYRKPKDFKENFRKFLKEKPSSLLEMDINHPLRLFYISIVQNKYGGVSIVCYDNFSFFNYWLPKSKVEKIKLITGENSIENISKSLPEEKKKVYIMVTNHKTYRGKKFAEIECRSVLNKN